jgi:DNA-nicking Smr family endonuclease
MLIQIEKRVRRPHLRESRPTVQVYRTGQPDSRKPARMGAMKRRPSTVHDDDSRLFREAIGDVRPMTPVEAVPDRPRPEPHPHMRDADEAAVPADSLLFDYDPADLEVGEELSYLRDGYPPKLLKQLKRGQFSIQADVDLHQMNVAAAQLTISEFLAECRRDGVRCVRIIHGKGLRSKAAGPVLKGLTDRLLRRRDDVVAFASARPMQGGTGAVVVLLKG